MASICVEIPEEVSVGIRIPKEELPSQIKKIVALELYRRKAISLGKACQLAEISKWEFFELNEKMQIPLYYDQEDWERDKKIAEKEGKK
ncbi:MAG: UPF0175 family protein [bacterium]